MEQASKQVANDADWTARKAQSINQKGKMENIPEAGFTPAWLLQSPFSSVLQLPPLYLKEDASLSIPQPSAGIPGVLVLSSLVSAVQCASFICQSAAVSCPQ